MKLFVKLMMLVLVMALAGPFFLKGPDGRPLMTLSSVTQKFKSWMNTSAPTSSSNGSVEVHKWQDENGQWHYSDAAPSQDSETISINPNANVIQSTPVPKAPAPADAPAAAEAPAEKESDMPSIFHPVDETNKVKEELEKRNEMLKQRLDDT